MLLFVLVDISNGIDDLMGLKIICSCIVCEV